MWLKYNFSMKLYFKFLMKFNTIFLMKSKINIYKTALSIAVKRNNLEIANLLLSAEKIDINMKLVFFLKYFLYHFKLYFLDKVSFSFFHRILKEFFITL